MTAAVDECWGGFYCPGGQSSPNPAEYICPQGMHCPNGSSIYQVGVQSMSHSNGLFSD